MSKHKKYVPKHKQSRAAGAPKKALRNTVVLSSIAVAATGISVGGGLAAGGASADRDLETVAADLDRVVDLPSLSAPEREPQVSRSADRRDATDPTKEAALEATGSTANAITRTEDVTGGDPREIGRALLAEHGWSSDQFGCLDSLWTRESNWRWNADNPSSSAYGIPQALPGSKMSSAGADWATNPVTQIRWGLGYIQDRYGTPCSAWGHSQSHNWY